MGSAPSKVVSVEGKGRCVTYVPFCVPYLAALLALRVRVLGDDGERAGVWRV